MTKKTEAAQKEELEVVKEELQVERRARLELTKEIANLPGRQIHGFLDFIREKGVVGLAVGLALGTAATALVTQIVGSIITPTVGLIVGEDGIKGLNTTVNIAGRTAEYNFGSLLDALIKFLAVAFVIYFVVKGLKLDKLDKKPEDKK